MGFSFGVLNAIRNEATGEYQARIPEATQETIASIGNALQTYTPLYNEFCDALINKIGKTILESKLFTNRLARFKQGTVLDQKDVEEIFIEMSQAESAYDPAGPNPLGRREGPDVKAIYHRQNRQDVYCITIGDIDFLRVFRSEATLDSFITARINSIYSGANHDEWLAMKKLLCSYDGYATVETRDEGDIATYCKEFVKNARKVAQDLTFVSDKYNGAGVNTVSAPGEMVLLVNKDLLTEIDVEVLSKSYNMGKTDIQFEVIPMDDFADIPLSNSADEVGYSSKNWEAMRVDALLIDKDFLRVFDTLMHFEPQRNAHGLFTNYFLHIHQILSLSRFKNAVAFLAVS